MEVLATKENEDGSMDLELDMTEEERDILLRHGLQLSVGDKMKVLPVEEGETFEGIQTHDLTDEESAALISLAVNDILRKQIEKEEKNEVAVQHSGN